MLYVIFQNVFNPLERIVSFSAITVLIRRVTDLMEAVCLVVLMEKHAIKVWNQFIYTKSLANIISETISIEIIFHHCRYFTEKSIEPFAYCYWRIRWSMCFFNHNSCNGCFYSSVRVKKTIHY